eukprot:9472434-Pyramimonas_sp.AAC.1
MLSHTLPRGHTRPLAVLTHRPTRGGWAVGPPTRRAKHSLVARHRDRRLRKPADGHTRPQP